MSSKMSSYGVEGEKATGSQKIGRVLSECIHGTRDTLDRSVERDIFISSSPKVQGKPENRKLQYSRIFICKNIHIDMVG